jgi:RNA polymerase sigma-70 factor (ECF subfamily)
VQYVSKAPGAAGNLYSVEYVAGAAATESITVSPTGLVVTTRAGGSTPSQIAAIVNASVASAAVTATAVLPASTSTIVAAGPAALTGGSSNVTLTVTYSEVVRQNTPYPGNIQAFQGASIITPLISGVTNTISPTVDGTSNVYTITITGANVRPGTGAQFTNFGGSTDLAGNPLAPVTVTLTAASGVLPRLATQPTCTDLESVPELADSHTERPIGSVRAREATMSMTIDDTEVIRAFKAGDHDAFESIVAEYQPELLRHAQRRVHDAGTAEDLVQETFVRAYNAFDRLPDDSRVRPWLHQILANLCIDEANRCKREHDKTARAAVEFAARRPSLSLEDELGLDIDNTALGVALAGLPDTHRDAIEKRFVDELGYDEIAEGTGVSETNARARVSRARSALRRALQGAAVIPVAVFLMFRRPGRGAMAAPPDPGGAAVASNAGRFATTFAPAIDAANSFAASAPATVPLLTKAAVGVGAVVAVSLSTGPERPIERPPAIVAEAAAPTVVDAPVVITTPVAVPVATAPVTASAPVAGAPQPATETTITTTAAALTDVPVASAPVPAAPVATTAPTTAAPTTVAPTTLPPTTVTPTTEPIAVLPPLTGGSLQSSVSITPAGPRLDLSGSVTLNVADASDSGSLSGRLGVGEPDPDGARRLDGTITIQLGAGSIELRLAGYGTSSEAPVDGTAPTSLSMSGVYRASGATGQLLTSGSFSGSLSGGSLSLTLSP